MTAISLLAEVRAAGVPVRLDGDSIKIPKTTPADLKARLRKHKAEVLAMLRYETLVARARRVEVAINDDGRREQLPDYERLLDSIIDTEYVLRRYGLSFAEIDGIIRAVSQ